MLDRFGYRLNVGMVICNSHGQVLWARRVRQNTWQFPQGGVNDNDMDEESAMFRELYEEVGLTRSDVYIMQTSKHYYRYRVPKRMLSERDTNFHGQRQRWFLLGFEDESKELGIAFNRQGHPEFDEWRWVSYWYPLRQVVRFKRDVYRNILTEFAPTALRL